MNFKIVTFTALFLIFSLAICLNAYSQTQNLIGLNFNGEIYPGRFRPAVGVTFERLITKHSGGETGLYYRTELFRGIISISGPTGSQSHSFTVSKRHVTLPLLYKYYSNIINFSAGPTFDLYMGWKQKNNTSTLQLQSFDVEPKIQIGYLIKASKTIDLNKRFIVEPEIRFGSVKGLDEAGLGIGIAGKYRF